MVKFLKWATDWFCYGNRGDDWLLFLTTPTALLIFKLLTPSLLGQSSITRLTDIVNCVKQSFYSLYWTVIMSESNGFLKNQAFQVFDNFLSLAKNMNYDRIIYHYYYTFIIQNILQCSAKFRCVIMIKFIILFRLLS